MTIDHVAIVLFDLALIIGLARAVGVLVRRLGQPPVIGEVLAGILLLPPLINAGIIKGLFPADIRGDLTVLADLGVALFMFVVGMEFDGTLLRGMGRVATSVSLSAVALPLTLGLGLGLFLEHDSRQAATHPAAFVLFTGVAVSITAFPVLARILTDRGMSGTTLGALALGSAAICDVAAWLLLALVTVLRGSGSSNRWTVPLLIAYLAAMLFVVRPLLRSVIGRSAGLDPSTLVVILTGLLVSAAATESLGLHFIFGAFMFGCVMPRLEAPPLGSLIQERISELNSVLLLPVFFVVAGLNVDLTKLGTSGVRDLVLVTAVAMVGKLLGGFISARLHRIPARQSMTMGVLLNTRGLTELIVLSAGRQLGLLDGRLYSAMVVMAIVTTAMTGPLLGWVYPMNYVERDRTEAAARKVSSATSA